MKKIALIILFGLSAGMYAQVNKNVTEETKTTTTTVDNGTEKKRTVTTEKTDKVQDIELKNADSNKLNKDIKETSVKVTKSETISGDGIPTQIGSTTYYTMNGTNYSFVKDKKGYKISTPENLNHGVLRKTSNNNYIYKTENKTSFGYFDADGNLVVETYDNDGDGVMVEKYTPAKKNLID
ncbi:hypothetical protein E0W68_05745 [Flavobacterium salilacus subsp. salilacus]|uniref:hypothetical protein n=1 Tax=Flavobacterium TaxID=237 RepID=UPI001075515F|nr:MULTISPECIES: hypothetical protein [Flavobacterium]KAF2519269.1 hypothetical protein E0W68_05745 [Flavobacterium salilacus subsp. salilacus]MBE1613454.1 hypothetical protein [Flavobacterium sp. SaA2.13]